MALSQATQATFNATVDALIQDMKDAFDVLTAGDPVYLTPLDIGDADPDSDMRANTAAGVTPSFSTVYMLEHVDDGDFPFRIVGENGEIVPLFWKFTNQARDLT